MHNVDLGTEQQHSVLRFESPGVAKYYRRTQLDA